MRLYKRGEYWWCSFPWQGETLRRSTRCTTRTAALLTAQRWERERADPDHAVAEAATFGTAVAGFLAELERSSKPTSTKGFYRAKCGVLVRHFGADLSLNLGVTAPRVDKFMADRELEPVAFDADGKPTRTVKANTIHKELVALRQILKRAKRRGEFRRDVSEVLPVGFSPKYVPRNVSLTLAEAASVCGTLAPARAAAVAFSLATTARRAEVFRARREDVDPSGSSVFLRGTKTDAAERHVAVAPFALQLIAFAVKHGGGKGGLLLKPWPNARRGLEAACKRVGAPRVTWNDLRRTLSTWLVEGGVSDTVIAKMLGHVDTTMLHRVYGKPKHDAMSSLLTAQSASIPAVQLAYVSAAGPALPPPVAAVEPTEKPAENSEIVVGRAGLEPATEGLKARESQGTNPRFFSANIALSRPDSDSPVRVLDASAEARAFRAQSWLGLRDACRVALASVGVGS